MTHAGPTKRAAGMVSQLLSGRSFPVIQWTGASKWVPVCSPKRRVFQYQAGPRSSYREIVSIETPGEAANIGGRSITGVVGPSGCDRSITRSRPAARSVTSAVRVEDMGSSWDAAAGGLNALAGSAEIGTDFRGAPGRSHT